MIFTGFKRKSNQFFFNRNKETLLENSRIESSNSIAKVVVIVNSLVELEEIKKTLSQLLNISENAIDGIVFQLKIKKEDKGEIIVTPKDFGWRGDVKSNKFENILTNQYDLLINYSKVENVYVNLLLLQCNVAFKVGFGHLNKELYDLIIKCETTETSIFHAELVKYLKILKKL